MKSSKYIKNIAFTNIIKKGQRTWLSLIAILLSTAIIFTSLTLFINVFTFSKNVNYDEIGRFHYATTTNEDVYPGSRYSLTKDINSGYYGNYENTRINFRSIEEGEVKEIYPFHLENGTLPTKKTEVLVPSNWNYEVGDQITLNISTQQIDEVGNEGIYHLPNNPVFDTQSKTYTVSGTYNPLPVLIENIGNYQIVYSSFKSNADDLVYYVQDKQIHLSDAYASLLEKFNVTDHDVYTNLDVISNDSVKNYLQDTTVILIMFILIAAIGIGMSLISVHNVLIISDKDRKKELGLLKSIGATPNEIKKLITIELIFLGVVGSLLGLGLGSTASYFILNLFIEKIYITFNWSMIFNPIILCVSFISGIALMYISGMKAYDKYIYSTAISDLKEFNYDYAEPIVAKNKRHRSFAWRMFSIYNGRMKKQTRNITASFTLLLFTCILFVSTFLSNAIYVNRYVSKGYDFEISNVRDGQGDSKVSTAITYELYKAKEDGLFTSKQLFAERIMLPQNGSLFFYTPESYYDRTLLDSYKVTQQAGYNREEANDGTMWADVYHFPTAFDDMQFKQIEKYLVEGSLDNLTTNSIVAIQSKTHRLGEQMCNYHVGDEVSWDGLDNKLTIAAIAVIPDEAYETELYFDYEKYPRIFAFSMEALVSEGRGREMNEHLYVKLKNSSAASGMLDVIDRIMYETETTETYNCNAVALTVETNRFATFIIEALLYPLFFMLFIVSIMNLNNVFIGNVHLKRGDISVMKSVGMTNAQLGMLFTFEYVEGYANAALISLAVFIPVVFLEKLMGIPSVYEFGSNIVGTIFMSLFLLGMLIVLPLVLISLKRIKRILPIENLKNVD